MKTITKLLILIALAMSLFTGCSKNSNGDANIIDINVTDGNVIDGNITDGNITDGNITDGNITIPIRVTYIINTLENKDIPLNASMLAQTKETKVKITRNIESEVMNIYVLIGSVVVTEVVISQ